MMTRIGELASSEMESGVNEQLEGFLRIREVGTVDGAPVVLLGQLSPAEARAHALALLEAAEAAEGDSLVARALTELELDPASMGAFIVRLRELRHADD